eukprot:225500-Pyramimonas_sp.AAC.1
MPDELGCLTKGLSAAFPRRRTLYCLHARWYRKRPTACRLGWSSIRNDGKVEEEGERGRGDG